MLAANVLALIFFREHIQISWWSIAPALLVAWGVVGSLRGDPYFYVPQPPFYPFVTYEDRYDKNSEFYDHMRELAGSTIRISSMFLIPLPIPFIFFFTGLPKIIFAFLVSVVPIAFPEFYATRKLKKELDNKDEQTEKELDEQKRREELGKWK